jgi:hypothetical protein
MTILGLPLQLGTSCGLDLVTSVTSVTSCYVVLRVAMLSLSCSLSRELVSVIIYALY